MKCLSTTLLGVTLSVFLSALGFSECDPDNTAPVLSGVPADVTLECANGIPPPLTNGIPTPLVTATDACDANPSVAFEVHFSDGGPGSIIVERTWTATDASGNSSVAMQTVSIFDNTPPEVQCNASNITVIDDSDDEVSFTATSTDVCSGVTTEVGWLVCIEPAPDWDEQPWWWVWEPCQVTTIYGDDDDDDDDSDGVIVEVDGATVTIIKSGDVGTVIGWTAQGTDDCGNTTTIDCAITVVEEIEEEEEEEVDDDTDEELPWWGEDPTAEDDDDADDSDDDASDDDDAGDDDDPWWGEDPTADEDDDDDDDSDDTADAGDDDDDGDDDADDEEELPWWW